MNGQAIDRVGETLHIHEYEIDGAEARFVSHTSRSMADVRLDAKRRAAETPSPTVKQTVKAGIDLMKAERQKSVVPDDVVEHRTDICAACPEGYNQPHDLGRCRGMKGCGCYLYAKVRSAKAECPAGHWSALST